MLLDKELIFSKYLKCVCCGSCDSQNDLSHVRFVQFTHTYQHVFSFIYIQPIKLGDHLNSILLGMCEDVIYARVSVRTVLDACSAHIRNSNCAPSFSYVKQLVKLVLGNLSRVSHHSNWYIQSHFLIQWHITKFPVEKLYRQHFLSED